MKVEPTTNKISIVQSSDLGEIKDDVLVSCLDLGLEGVSSTSAGDDEDGCIVRSVVGDDDFADLNKSVSKLFILLGQ